MSERTILIVGTVDTKEDELNYIAEVIGQQGGAALTMDVSVLGDPSAPTDISKHEVAEAGGSSIKEAIAGEDENLAADGAFAAVMDFAPKSWAITSWAQPSAQDRIV